MFWTGHEFNVAAVELGLWVVTNIFLDVASSQQVLYIASGQAVLSIQRKKRYNNSARCTNLLIEDTDVFPSLSLAHIRLTESLF